MVHVAYSIEKNAVRAGFLPRANSIEIVFYWSCRNNGVRLFGLGEKDGGAFIQEPGPYDRRLVGRWSGAEHRAP